MSAEVENSSMKMNKSTCQSPRSRTVCVAVGSFGLEGAGGDKCLIIAGDRHHGAKIYNIPGAAFQERVKYTE